MKTEKLGDKNKKLAKELEEFHDAMFLSLVSEIAYEFYKNPEYRHYLDDILGKERERDRDNKST